MYPQLGLTASWFVAASSLIGVVYLLSTARRNRVDQRLDSLEKGSGQEGAGGGPGASARRRGSLVVATDNRLDRWVSRRMRQTERKKTLKDRMSQAGFYGGGSAKMFIVVRVLLLVGPIAAGYALGQMGIVPFTKGVVWGAIAGLAGTLAPSFWLDHLKRARQTKLRRALPDALDVLVVCLEGGLSLVGSFSRVARELATAHPLLAIEFQIIERQTQMGRTTGEAVRELANRFDLEELRSMASVIIQAERIGSSVASALGVFADTLRLKRHQRAEELAQKASLKLLIPTAFCIFPGIFITILGPAIIQLYEVFIKSGMLSR